MSEGVRAIGRRRQRLVERSRRGSLGFSVVPIAAYVLGTANLPNLIESQSLPM